MPVKKSNLCLQNLVTSANDKYLSLLREISEMIGYVMGTSTFSTANHLLVLREERCEGLKIQDDANNAKLKGLINDHKSPGGRLVLRAKNTGSWLTAQGSTVTGIVLAATEFRYFLCV